MFRCFDIINPVIKDFDRKIFCLVSTETFGRKRPLPISTSFCGATGQLGTKLLTVEEFRLHSIRHTHTHTHTLSKTPLDEGSVRRRDLYLTICNTHRRETYMPQGGSEPAIPASQRSRTHAVERAVTSVEQFQLNSYIPQTKLKKKKT